MTTFRILGLDDSVTSCECCGKSGLKHTVVVEVDGVVMHYGSVCATRHTGKTSAKIHAEIDARIAKRVQLARAEFADTVEYVQLMAAHQDARALGLIGVEYRAHIAPQVDAANVVRRHIADKYAIDAFKI